MDSRSKLLFLFVYIKIFTILSKEHKRKKNCSCKRSKVIHFHQFLLGIIMVKSVEMGKEDFISKFKKEFNLE